MIQSIGQRRLVVDASVQAQRKGVRIGTCEAEARVMAPGLFCINHDSAADRRTLDALGRWMTRFTPIVARGWDCEDENENIPAVLFLDVTGCERLFGGIPRLAKLVEQAAERFGIPFRIAVAPTPGAAWALTQIGKPNGVVIETSALPEVVLQLPIELLRLNVEILKNLRHLGICCVREVMQLPREQLPSRFGPLLLKRLDQLTGTRPEPLTKLINQPPIREKLEFDAPIESPKDIGLIYERLLDRVVAELARRQHGARQLGMMFKPDRGWGREVVRRTIKLSRPHRNRQTLLELMRCEIERIDCEHGFVRFQLEVPVHEPISDAQAQLFDQQAIKSEMELDRLFQRLRVRMGERAVLRPTLVESYIPERAWRPAGEGEAPRAAMAVAPPRPLTVFPTPVEIRVVYEPSDDRTGDPRQFSWQQQVHRLIHIVGPERIAGEWWRGHRHTRDYYEVEDEAGRRFWIFRVIYPKRNETFLVRWFLHGRFD